MKITDYRPERKYEGTHGTTVDRCKNIKKEGFSTPKKSGQKGTGIYFWFGHDDFSYCLAVGWYKQCYKEGRYNSDINKNCAVIYAFFNIDDDQFVDISAPEFTRIIREYVNRDAVKNHKDLAKVYDKIINKLEKEIGRRILVYLTQVTPPRREYMDFNRIDRIIGDPFTYIIRDKNIINIGDTKEYCHDE